MLKKSVENDFLEYRGQQIPIKIHREWRRSVRASFGRRHIIFRLPIIMSKREQKLQLNHLKDWAINYLNKEEKLRKQFFRKSYSHGDELVVGQRKYKLNIQKEDRKTHGGNIKDGIITLKLSNQETESNLGKSIRTLLSRLVGKDYQKYIEQRVDYFNDNFFKKEINSIRLKYNKSNWGSCSLKGNINISTRLLFAPPEVIDYVIVHELAHTIEMNHSPKFWKIVSDIFPNYKDQEMWLKKHGPDCDF